MKQTVPELIKEAGTKYIKIIYQTEDLITKLKKHEK